MARKRPEAVLLPGVASTTLVVESLLPKMAPLRPLERTLLPQRASANSRVDAVVEAVVVVALPAAAAEAVLLIGTLPLAKPTPTRRSTRAGEAMNPTLSSSKSKPPPPTLKLKLLLPTRVLMLGGLLPPRVPTGGLLPPRVRLLGGLPVPVRVRLPPKASLAGRRRRRRRTTPLLLSNTSQRRRTRTLLSPSSRLPARPMKELVMTSGRVLSL